MLAGPRSTEPSQYTRVEHSRSGAGGPAAAGRLSATLLAGSIALGQGQALEQLLARFWSAETVDARAESPPTSSPGARPSTMSGPACNAVLPLGTTSNAAVS